MAENNEGNVERDSADLVTLVKRIQNRDERGLADLYDRMSRLVYSLAYSIVHTHEYAEEVTQEVFVRVWNKIDYFDSARGSVPAWMSTMTRRLAIDRIRSRSFKARGRESSLDVVEFDGRGGSDANIEQLAEAGKVRGCVRNHSMKVFRMLSGFLIMKACRILKSQRNSRFRWVRSRADFATA